MQDWPFPRLITLKLPVGQGMVSPPFLSVKRRHGVADTIGAGTVPVDAKGIELPAGAFGERTAHRRCV